MLMVILYAAAIVLSLVGLVEIIRTAALFLLSERESPEQLLIVLLNDENAEAALRSALERLKIMGRRSCRQIIAVDTGLSEASAEICRKFCDDCGCIALCSSESLYELIISISRTNSQKPGD